MQAHDPLCKEKAEDQGGRKNHKRNGKRKQRRSLGHGRKFTDDTTVSVAVPQVDRLQRANHSICALNQPVAEQASGACAKRGRKQHKQRRAKEQVPVCCTAGRAKIKHSFHGFPLAHNEEEPEQGKHYKR